MFNSIFHRVMTIYFLIILLTFLALTFFLSHLVSNYLYEEREKELINQGQELAKSFLDFLKSGYEDETSIYLLDTMDRFLDARIWIVNTRGLIIATSERHRRFRGVNLSLRELEQVLSGLEMTRKGFLPFFDVPMISVAVPIQTEGRVLGALFLHSPLLGISKTLVELRRLIFYAAIFSIFLAMILGYFLSRSISSPLKELNQVALKMAEGDFQHGLKVRGKDEVGQLATSFNHLTSRLEETMDALYQEKDKLHYMVESMMEGVLALNQEGDLLLINPPAKALLQLCEGDLLGKNLYQTIKPKELGNLMEEVLLKGEGRTGEYQLKNKKSILTHISPIRGRYGDVIGVVALLQDVSQIEQMDAMKREFVANVSHELKTPLTAIRGFIQPLLDGTMEDEEGKKRYLKIIEGESIRLNRLIEELLDFSTLDQKGIRTIPIRLMDVVIKAITRLKLLYQEKGVLLMNHLHEDLPLVQGDTDRLEQVFNNLLENALHYTPSGGEVVICAKVEGEYVMTQIRDTGIGIPPGDLPHIWKRFYKGDPARGIKDRKGTGLGLSIVKDIVEACGGHISVKSKGGEGSTFIFSLKRVEGSNGQRSKEEP